MPTALTTTSLCLILVLMPHQAQLPKYNIYQYGEKQMSNFLQDDIAVTKQMRKLKSNPNQKATYCMLVEEQGYIVYLSETEINPPEGSGLTKYMLELKQKDLPALLWKYDPDTGNFSQPDLTDPDIKAYTDELAKQYTINLNDDDDEPIQCPPVNNDNSQLVIREQDWIIQEQGKEVAHFKVTAGMRIERISVEKSASEVEEEIREQVATNILLGDKQFTDDEIAGMAGISPEEVSSLREKYGK